MTTSIVLIMSLPCVVALLCLTGAVLWFARQDKNVVTSSLPS